MTSQLHILTDTGKRLFWQHGGYSIGICSVGTFSASLLLSYCLWLRITDEGSVPKIRIWSILLIKSDLKWCIHISRRECDVNWLFNVTINDISVIYVTAHWCAGGLKKLDLRSGSQRHRLFEGFFNVPVIAQTRGQPFYTVIPRNRPILSPFTTRLGYRGHILDLTPGSPRSLLYINNEMQQKS